MNTFIKSYFKIFTIVLMMFLLSGLISYGVLAAVKHDTQTKQSLVISDSDPSAVDKRANIEGVFKANDGILSFNQNGKVIIDIFGIEGTYDYHYNDGAYFIQMGTGTGYMYYDDTSDSIRFAGLKYFRVENDMETK